MQVVDNVATVPSCTEYSPDQLLVEYTAQVHLQARSLHQSRTLEPILVPNSHDILLHVGMHAPDQTAIIGSIPTSSKNRRYSRRPRPLCDGSQPINTVRHGDDDALGIDILPGTHSARSVDEGANGRVPLPPRVREYTLDYN